TATDQETENLTLDPAVLDRYVGFYCPYNGEFGYYTITRDGGKLIAQITGQPSVDLHPVGEAEFSIKVVDAQITFIRDSDGNATALVLRQQGIEIKGMRIDAAEAKQLKARLTERIENKIAKPGSEAALRRLIEGIRAGAPDYEQMSPGFAQVM